MRPRKDSPPAGAQAFAQAQQLHRSGRLDAAAGAYEAILARAPGHFDALHFLGILEAQRRNFDQASHLLERATAADPHHSAAWNNLGNALRDARRAPDALAAYERALALRPDYPEALNNQGTVLRVLGRLEDALRSFDRALALRPQFPEALNNRGNVLRELKRGAEALASYDAAIALRPDYAEAYNNRGTALLDLQRGAGVLADYDRALALNPTLVEALSNRGNALRQLARPDDALASYEAAIALCPDFPDAHINRGAALGALRRHEDALASYDRALALQPAFADAWNNRGATLMSLNRHDEALESYDRALQLDPGFVDARWNRSLCLLLRGAFEEGWLEYEWRWRRAANLSVPQRFAQPAWRGHDSLSGRTLLLHAEQGFGDTIQFCRYATLAAEQGARVILHVPPPLAPLLAQLDGVAQIVAGDDVLPAFDLHCPLLSLPLAFGTRLDSIPARVPYLSAPPARTGKWRERLGEKTAPRIGLAWSGSATHDNDRNRSLPLAAMLPLAATGARFYCLQKEMRPADRPLLAQAGIDDLGDALHDFADTAALIAEMDLVIAVDTSVAHLAGAMNRPLWLLLPFAPDWRWLLGRGDSPWYPGARLYRQAAIGDWAQVIARLAADLAGVVGR